jgi:hypothetical protein
MRIFLSCQQALRPHPVPAYSFWEYYFKNALAEAGHEIIQAPGIDWAEGLTPLSSAAREQWLELTWTRTVDFLRAEHAKRPVDLFLGYLFPNQVDPSAVRTIRGIGIPTVNFFCDNLREFTDVPAAFRSFDLHWVPEFEAGPMYASAGLRFIIAPMPMWVLPEYRDMYSLDTKGVVFIGSHDDLREDLLGEAVGLGLPVQIYGSGWGRARQPQEAPARTIATRLRSQLGFMARENVRGWIMGATYQLRRKRPNGWIESHTGPVLDDKTYVSTMRDAEVVIGINRCPTFRRPFSNPLRYSRLRDIEGPMLGACYLTEMAPGLDALYDLGTEIETYRSAGELVEKSRRLQRDPSLRAQLRVRGQRRALSDHTIGRSLERIVGKLGIPT